MKAEVENALRRTETGEYLLKACKADSDLAVAVESDTRTPSESNARVPACYRRAGGPGAFKAAELLASAIKRVRKAD
jgi:hypothetical protein